MYKKGSLMHHPVINFLLPMSFGVRTSWLSTNRKVVVSLRRDKTRFEKIKLHLSKCLLKYVEEHHNV